MSLHIRQFVLPPQAVRENASERLQRRFLRYLPNRQLKAGCGAESAERRGATEGTVENGDLERRRNLDLWGG